MYAKIQITGMIEVKTGLHIGGSSAFAAIGAVDAPVIKDTRTNLPMIPGSSLKGKLRALLAEEYNPAVVKPDDDDKRLLRLFGCARKEKSQRSRIIISDMFLCNEQDLRKRGLQSLTEVKFENTINRMTAVANPRQIERVVRGSQFDMDMIYEVDHTLQDESEIVEDMKMLAEGFKLLQYDYLGGSGSRGYGKVLFTNFQVDNVVGNVPDGIMKQCQNILSAIEMG